MCNSMNYSKYEIQLIDCSVRILHYKRTALIGLFVIEHIPHTCIMCMV